MNIQLHTSIRDIIKAKVETVSPGVVVTDLRVGPVRDTFGREGFDVLAELAVAARAAIGQSEGGDSIFEYRVWSGALRVSPDGRLVADLFSGTYTPSVSYASDVYEMKMQRLGR